MSKVKGVLEDNKEGMDLSSDGIDRGSYVQHYNVFMTNCVAIERSSYHRPLFNAIRRKICEDGK